MNEKMRIRWGNYNFEKGKHSNIDCIAQKKESYSPLIYLTAHKRSKSFLGLNFCCFKNKAELENILLHVPPNLRVWFINNIYFFYSIYIFWMFPDIVYQLLSSIDYWKAAPKELILEFQVLYLLFKSINSQC